MRQAVIDHVRNSNPGGFFVSEDIPWSESQTFLYLKNLKTVYIGAETTQTEDFIRTLNYQHVKNKIHSVTVTFANDAKTIPPSYQDFVDRLRDFNTESPTFYAKEIDVSTSTQNDVLITTIQYRFTKILT